VTSAYVKDFGETRWRDKQGTGQLVNSAKSLKSFESQAELAPTEHCDADIAC